MKVLFYESLKDEPHNSAIIQGVFWLWHKLCRGIVLSTPLQLWPENEDNAEKNKKYKGDFQYFLKTWKRIPRSVLSSVTMVSTKLFFVPMFSIKLFFVKKFPTDSPII